MALWPWVVETKGTGPPSPVDCVPVICVYVGGVCVCGGVGYLRELDTNFLNVLIDIMCMLVHVVSLDTQASSIKLVSH